jgi:hypothetical protein
MDLRRLQPLLEAIQRLLERGLAGMEILRIFFSRRVQSLCRRQVNAQMHMGPIFLDCPFSMELGNMGINTWI